MELFTKAVNNLHKSATNKKKNKTKPTKQINIQGETNSSTTILATGRTKYFPTLEGNIKGKKNKKKKGKKNKQTNQESIFSIASNCHSSALLNKFLILSTRLLSVPGESTSTALTDVVFEPDET